MPSIMLEEAVAYAPRLGFPLFITAKRYWLPAFEAHANDPEALTLVVLHSTSFHKETWEPTLEHLFKLTLQRGSTVKIREAWALDCPNHGVASRLNERILAKEEFTNNFTCEKYAQAAHHFLSAGPNHGARIDFRKRNLVGVGHSLGGNAVLILQHLEPVIHFSSIIIAEPMLSPAGPQYLKKLRTILVKGAYERRDVWPDKESAMRAMKRRDRTKNWDPRILELFVKYAIKPHPGSHYEETPYLGFTLACSRDQEAAMYRDADGPTKPVADLNKACAEKPVHLILGGVNDFMPARIHAALTDHASGRRYASVTKIEEAGHLIPQEVPDQLGDVLHDILAMESRRPAKAKL